MLGDLIAGSPRKMNNSFNFLNSIKKATVL